MKVKSKAGADYVGNLVNVGKDDITWSGHQENPNLLVKEK